MRKVTHFPTTLEAVQCVCVCLGVSYCSKETNALSLGKLMTLSVSGFTSYILCAAILLSYLSSVQRLHTKNETAQTKERKTIPLLSKSAF